MENNENAEKFQSDGEAPGLEESSDKQSPATDEKSPHPGGIDDPAIPPLMPVTAANSIEPDSTVAENPVNLKMEPGDIHQVAEEQQQPTANSETEVSGSPAPIQSSDLESHQRSSPPPLTQHVRTITLTSDYHQQRQENTVEATANEELGVPESSNNAGNTSIYVEEGVVEGNHQDVTEGSYYHQHHYTEQNGTGQSGRYREMLDSHNKQSDEPVQHSELLDAAAAAAGVPTSYIMMEGEEDDQGDRSSAYIGSRLATFQVT